jgi:hypothetical protein
VRGVTVVELLVAMLITLLVTAAGLSFIGPAHDAFLVQAESSDVQQRIRVGVDALYRDLVASGAGMYLGGTVGPLHQAIAPVMPYTAFGPASDSARGVYFRPDAISLMFVPSTPSQTFLAASAEAGALEISIENVVSCPRTTVAQVCGFGSGDQLLVFDRAGAWEVFTVEGVGRESGRLRLKGQAPARAFPAHSQVTEIKAVTYSLKRDAASHSHQLVRADALDPAQPVLDQIVKLEFQYFGEPHPPRLLDPEPGGRSDPHASYGPAPSSLNGSAEEWPAGENCTFALIDGQPEARLALLAASDGLVELPPALLTDGPWCPDAGALNRFDADLLRIRRVRLTLRVQTSVAALRGPAGRLFTNGGTASAGSRLVPDMEIQLDVTPRNLNLAR